MGWYACRFEEEETFTYALTPGEAWTMKDQQIMDLTMENVVTTAAEGTAAIRCTVGILAEDPQEYGLEIKKRTGSHSEGSGFLIPSRDVLCRESRSGSAGLSKTPKSCFCIPERQRRKSIRQRAVS